MRNERGVTLVEVLATLTILSIISVTTWQIFFQGYKFSQESVTKNMLQQESNIVLSNLTRIHQTTEKYKLISSDCKITVLDKNDDELQLFSHSLFCYKAENPIDNLELPPTVLEPSKTGHDLELVVRVSEKNNLRNSVAVKTLLYRLKEGERYE
jgi:prepilin-type N-terminal cleavage/methylation domain-containing protein